MKALYWVVIATILCSTACKKSNSNGENKPEEPKATVTGNVISYPTGYAVKFMGVSRMLIAVDENEKLTVATLYGGGNKVVLKPGTGNTIEMISSGYATLPDGFPPDGVFGGLNGSIGVKGAIDNGTIADTNYVSVKIKGFDKAKTGYNQLNLIVRELIKATPPGDGGFHTNLAWIAYNSKRKNADYSGLFFKTLLTGNIAVAEVQEAKPVSQNPYIVEDQVLSTGVFSYTQNQLTNFRTYSNTFSVLIDKSFVNNYSLGGPFKYEWINADKGTVTKLDDYTYQLDFANMLPENAVALASDTSSKVFLRVAGMNPSVTGFNQLRLFLGKSNNRNQGFLLTTGQKLSKTPTLTEALAMIKPGTQVVSYAAPLVHHY